LNSGSEWTQTVTYVTLSDTYQREALEISKTRLGVWAGAGLMKSIGKGLNAYIEFRYERTDGINAEDFVAVTKSNVTSFQFIIGLSTR
jgi:hypothetical protein